MGRELGTKTMMSGDPRSARAPSPYVGWVAAAIILLVTFVAAAGVWVIFHP